MGEDHNALIGLVQRALRDADVHRSVHLPLFGKTGAEFCDLIPPPDLPLPIPDVARGGPNMLSLFRHLDYGIQVKPFGGMSG